MGSGFPSRGRGGLRPPPLSAAKRERGVPIRWSPSLTELPVPLRRCLPAPGEAVGSGPAPRLCLGVPAAGLCRRRALSVPSAVPSSVGGVSARRTGRFTLHAHSSSPPAPQRSAPRSSPGISLSSPAPHARGREPRPEAAVAPSGQQVAPRAAAAEARGPE